MLTMWTKFAYLNIRSNLDPWGHYTDAQIWEALEKTHIKDMVSKSRRFWNYFPNVYD